MNFLFSFAIYAAVIVFLWLLRLAPLGWKIQYRTLAVFSVVVLLLGAWFSAMAYGPRVRLEQTRMPTGPEKTEVETGGDMFDSGNKWDRLNQKLEENKARQAEEGGL